MNVDIENVAGIRAGRAEIRPGLTVVKAENWQGKSSFMTALQVVMGTTGWDGTGHPLTDGTAEGRVRLETADRSFETELLRSGETVHRQGEVYLTDEHSQLCARLFAFLGENNPVREAVRSDGDLASLLTKPLDIENIDEQIDRLKREREAVEGQLEEAEGAAERLAPVQTAVTDLEADISELRERREDLSGEAEPGTADPEADELSSKRAEKEQVTSQIATLENKIERQEDRLSEREAELEGLTIPAEPELTADIDDHRSRIAELETNIGLLEDLHRVNKRVLDEERATLVTAVQRSMAGDAIECWLCGEGTTESAIADRLASIAETIDDFRAEKSDLEREIAEIRERREEVREQRRRRDDLETEISELRVTLEENRSRLAELEERLEDVTAELDRLRETVEETNSQLTDIESELKYKQNELEEKRAELAQLEDAAGRRERLRDERDDLSAEIESLRSRRNQKQRELAERFEERMGEIVDAFEPGFGSARLTPKTDGEGNVTEFDLVVAREGRETSLDALSEGEVELLGIVTALAGYETFDVGDRVPFILLDGLTALSSENYHAVVEYLHERTERLVTTAYPEIGDFDGHVISPRDWDVVSDRVSVP